MASPGSGPVRSPRYVEMIGSKCANCGGGTSLFAKACPHCGAPRGLRLARIGAAGAMVLLLAAVLVAVVVVLRWDQLAAATETGALPGERIVAGATAGLGWLTNAMKACDAEAKEDAGALHFLVTPLAPAAGDLEPWRAKSISGAGNGIVLRTDDMLDGLKSGALRVYPADYGFSVLDPAGEKLYRWRPSVGVRKFSTAEVGPISTFKVQFRTSHSGADDDWGGSFNRLAGACHWVNAVVGK